MKLTAKIARYRELARSVTEDKRAREGIAKLIAELQTKLDTLKPS